MKIPITRSLSLKTILTALSRNWILLAVLLGLAFLTKSSLAFWAATEKAINVPAGLPAYGGEEIPYFEDLKGCSSDNPADPDNCGDYWWYGLLAFIVFELIVFILIVKWIRNAILARRNKTKPRSDKRKVRRKWLTVLLKVTGVVLLQILAAGLLIIFLVVSVIQEKQASTLAEAEIGETKEKLLQAVETGETVLGDPESIKTAIEQEREMVKIAGRDFMPLSILFLRNADLNNLSYYEKVILMSKVDDEAEKNFSMDFPKPLVYFPKYKTVLVVRESLEDMAAIFPLVATHNIRLNEGIRDYVREETSPLFRLLIDAEYNEIIEGRKDQIRKRYLGTIQQIQGEIARLANFVEETGATINKIEQEKADYESRTRSWLNECYQILGESHSRCSEGKQTIQTNISEYQQTLDQLRGYVEEAKKYQTQNRAILGQWEQVLVNFENNPVKILDQGGVFLSPKDVYVKLLFDGDGGISEFSAMIHELLHFYAYRQNITLPDFLIEGITDFMAVKVRDDATLEPYEGVGYPELVNIASSLASGLGGKKLTDIYFSGSLAEFKRAFNDTYGASNYKKFMDLGDQLFYAPLNEDISRDQLLQQMLELIGGTKEIKESPNVINYTF